VASQRFRLVLAVLFRPLPSFRCVPFGPAVWSRFRAVSLASSLASRLARSWSLVCVCHESAAAFLAVALQHPPGSVDIHPG
jgi:hypothetical protein